MSVFRLLITYSLRLITREWRRFVLSFFSLLITATVLFLVLMVTGASSDYLAAQARELQGGDVVLESSYPVAHENFWQTLGITPVETSVQIEFSATVESVAYTSPVSLRVVDDAFPLYGDLQLQNGIYSGLGEQEILIDAAGAKKLAVVVGDTVRFGSESYMVKDIIVQEPTALFGGFQFLPRAIMSAEGFARSQVDPTLLRAEYVYGYIIPDLQADDTERIRSTMESFDASVDVDIAGEDRRGLQFGLQTVSDFLTVAVLITAVLAAVNVYASIVYLITIERKSLAILQAIGLSKRALILLLGMTFSYVVIVAAIVGSGLGMFLFTRLSTYIADVYLIPLPTAGFGLYTLVTMGVVTTIALASFLPAVRQTLSRSPKLVLIGGEEIAINTTTYQNFIKTTMIAFVPLTVLATVLLRDVWQGVVVMGVIALLYATVALVFAGLLRAVYLRRHWFGFYLRTIIAQKKADGVFGIISFSSLFVALLALGSLVLTQSSLKNFLVADLAQTIPSTYVLDVQPSQKEELATSYPELALFSNIGARIISIDGLRIQDELLKDDTEVDRELGREFNLTARTELLESESVVAGVWGAGKSGEISVDKDFAEQANINLGSQVEFSVQGFPVSGVVTSLRDTDSRSGLPFFYFVLSPDDIGQFSGVSFGYAFYDEVKQAELGRFLASAMPNVSMIETQNIGPLLVRLIDTLLLLIVIVTIPPLLIATLLIATLIISSYDGRRRDGGRLRALGATKQQVFWQYVSETTTLALAAAIIAYVGSLITTYVIAVEYLGLSAVTWFTIDLGIGLGLIIGLVFVLASYLFITDRMPLRALLSYESTN